MTNPFLWAGVLLAIGALAGIFFDEQLTARGIGPGVVALVALLAAFAWGGRRLLQGKPDWIVVWLLVFAGLALAYEYVPGLRTWFESR